MVELAEHLHRYGTTAQRLEAAVDAVAQQLGLECEPWSNPTGMVLSFNDPARPGGESDTTRVIAYVVSGVGFLGAGTIMKEGLNVRGLNTAATLWGSAAVGAAAGSDLVGQAILITLFVLASNILLRPVVDRINRTPLDNQASEVTYTMCVISTSERQKEALADLERLLEEASYPISDLSVEPFGDDHVEVEAMLMSTAVNAAELDRIVTSLQSQPHVAQAFWNPSTTE